MAAGGGMLQQSFTLPSGGYRITFSAVTGYDAPADIYLNLLTGDTQTITGTYTVPAMPVGTLVVSTNLTNGAYNILNVWGTPVAAGGGMNPQSFTLPSGGYQITFSAVTGYDPVADIYVNLLSGTTEIRQGTYTVPAPLPATLLVSTNLTNGAYNIYDVLNNPVAAGGGMLQQSFSVPAGGYRITYSAVTGYDAPADEFFNVLSGETHTSVGTYTVPTPVTGTLEVSTNLSAGSYEVFDVNNNSMGTGTGMAVTSFALTSGAYSVVFGPVSGYTTPAPEFINLSASQTTTVVGNYVPTVVQSGSVQINITDDSSAPISDGDWELRSCTGNTLPDCTTAYANGTDTQTLTNVPVGTYGLFVTLTSGYSSVMILSVNPQDLTDGNTITFDVEYTPVITTTTATLEITTTPVVGEIFVDGISIGSPASAGTFLTQIVDTSLAHTISFGPVANYTAPANILIPANSLTANSTTQYTGTYAPIVINNNATLEIATTPVTGEVFVDNVSIGTAAVAGTFLSTTVDRTLAHTISFGAVANYTTPADIVIAANTLAGGSTTQYTGTYTAIVINTATIQVTTQPFAAEIFVNGVSIGTPAAAGTLLTTTVDITVPNVITFANVNGYQSPTIAIPANTLANGSTTQYTGTYTNDFVLTKTASVTNVGDNQVITYTIVLDRNTTAPGSITVRLTDTLTGTGVINGNNGGALNVILNAGTCTGVTCSGTQINQGFIDVTMDDSSSVATLTYQVRSSNAGIPVNGTSAAVNTVTATYGAITLTDSETVTIQGPTGNTGCTVNCGGGTGGGGGGSSSGNGGGHVQIKGDMKLEIKKEVSIDGTNFVDASNKSHSFAIPEKQQTRLYTRLTLKNLGKVTATKIKLDPFFTQGDTDMFADGIENILGARLDTKTGQLMIDEIKAGKSATVTYSRMIDERGQNSNLAIDGVKLVKFGSRLPTVQDGLKYLGIGESTVSYLFAGEPNFEDFATAGSDVMTLSLTASSAIAKVGDLVNFTLKATNVSDSDLTGLYFTFDYDENGFAIAKAIGAKDDGRALSWKRLILRPGETATFNFSARVIGGTLLISTVRAMANEVENLPTLTHELQVSGVASGVKMRLAQTGALSITLMALMFALAALGYKSLERRSYKSLRAMALMPV
jgi:hypothetical protein